MYQHVHRQKTGAARHGARCLVRAVLRRCYLLRSHLAGAVEGHVVRVAGRAALQEGARGVHRSVTFYHRKGEEGEVTEREWEGKGREGGTQNGGTSLPPLE